MALRESRLSPNSVRVLHCPILDSVRTVSVFASAYAMLCCPPSQLALLSGRVCWCCDLMRDNCFRHVYADCQHAGPRRCGWMQFHLRVCHGRCDVKSFLSYFADIWLLQTCRSIVDSCVYDHEAQRYGDGFNDRRRRRPCAWSQNSVLVVPAHTTMLRAMRPKPMEVTHMARLHA